MLSSVTINCQVNKDCHEFRFSIVRIVISVSNVTSLQDCLFNCQNGKSNCLNCENCRQLSKFVKIVGNCQNCQKLSRLLKMVKIVKNSQHCWKLSKLSKLSKIVKNCQNCQKLSKLSNIVKNVKTLTNCPNYQKLSKVVKIVKKNCQNVGQVMFPHHCDQMFERLQVSRVALCMSKSKGHSVSEWVTRSPIELFWTAKH